MALAAAPVAAHAGYRPDPALTLLQQRDQRLFELGWTLVTANAPFCANTAPGLGLQVLDAGGFGNPGQVREQLGLTGDIAIGSLAAGSPAARAGLAVNDTLLAIAGEPVANRFPPSKPSWQRLIDVTAALDAAAALGPVVLTVRRGEATPRVIIVKGVPACPSRFEVADRGKAAMSEGTRVIFGRDFSLFKAGDEPFRVVIAHELAHNLLGHNGQLTEMGRSLGNKRLAEREADRLMPWLLANAGQDPETAVRLAETWLRENDGGLFRARNHEAWDERAEAIRAEVALVRAALAEDGKADWAHHFRRETLSQRR